MRAPDERNSARAEMTGPSKQSRAAKMDCFVASGYAHPGLGGLEPCDARTASVEGSLLAVRF
jgi:hypothetical protein